MKQNFRVIFIVFLICLLLIFMGCFFVEQIIGQKCPEIDSNSVAYLWTVNLNSGITGENYCQIGTGAPIESTYARVFMEYESNDTTLANKVATEFDKLYPTITEKFGDPVLTDANNYNNQGKKVTIFLLDIQDGYDPIFNPAYVGGYFYSVDYLTESSLQAEYPNEHSNEQAILYIDIDPQDPTTDSVNSTIAHEFQHMINFSENVLNDGNNSATIDNILNADVPTWINEGFAMAAEQIWAKEVKGYTNPKDEWPVYSRIQFFNSSDNYTEGNPLMKWMDGNVVLSNYSSAFLFFQYIRVHSELGSDVFKTMMDISDNTYTQVDSILPINTGAKTFQKVYEDWLVANVLNLADTTSPYGYANAEGLKDVRAAIGSEAKELDFYAGSFIYRKGAGDISSYNFDTNIGLLIIDETAVKIYTDPIEVGNDISNDKYLVVYDNRKVDDNTAITVSIPSGSTVSDKTLSIGRYANNTKPYQIDWLFTKPISQYTEKTIPKLPTFEN